MKRQNLKENKIIGKYNQKKKNITKNFGDINEVWIWEHNYWMQRYYLGFCCYSFSVKHWLHRAVKVQFCGGFFPSKICRENGVLVLMDTFNWYLWKTGSMIFTYYKMPHLNPLVWIHMDYHLYTPLDRLFLSG